MLTLFGILFGVVLFVVVVGEWLDLFEEITARVPWPIGLAIVVIAGYPIFRNVIRATLKGQIIAHTLMSVFSRTRRGCCARSDTRTSSITGY